MKPLSILYRGPLRSCNYDCAYCPFTKQPSTREELAADKTALLRFVEWAGQSKRPLSIVFTPSGEALIRPYYQEALRRLSHFENVERVAVQTNLSFKQRWLGRVNLECLVLCATFHPTETSLEDFVDRCERLVERGVRFTVGVVAGQEEHVDLAEQLGRTLPEHMSVDRYAPQSEEQVLITLDSRFPLNNNDLDPSVSESCQTEPSVIHVDGLGDIRHGHLGSEVVGNIYTSD